MKAKKIIYEKLFNLGNYTHEKIGIELEVQDGEKASEVLERAKQFVNGLDPKKNKEEAYLRAKAISNNPGNNSYNSVIEANEIIREYEQENNQEDDDLPF